jgi:hypothetical protein
MHLTRTSTAAIFPERVHTSNDNVILIFIEKCNTEDGLCSGLHQWREMRTSKIQNEMGDLSDLVIPS